MPCKSEAFLEMLGSVAMQPDLDTELPKAARKAGMKRFGPG
jgi:hypothetical protein